MLRRLLQPPKAASFLETHGETLANLSITGHLRSFSDQPVAEIVQCGGETAQQYREAGFDQ